MSEAKKAIRSKSDKVTCPFYLHDEQSTAQIPCKSYIPGTDKGFCKKPVRSLCVEDFKMKKVHTSVSTILEFMSCPRKFYFSHILGYKVKDLPAWSATGQMVHELLASIYKGVDNFKEIAHKYMPGDEWKQLPFFQALAVCYAYQEIHQKIEPAFSMENLQPEESFSLELDNLIIHGISDIVGKDFLVEHKYTGNFDYYTIYHTFLQAGVYLMAYPEAECVYMNLIKNPSLKLLKNKTSGNETLPQHFNRVTAAVKEKPGSYFKRLKFFRTEYNFDQVRALTERVLATMQWMLQAEDDQFFYENRQACDFPSECIFKACCETGSCPSEIVGKYQLKKKEEA